MPAHDVLAKVLHGAVGYKKFMSKGTIADFTEMKLLREKIQGVATGHQAAAGALLLKLYLRCRLEYWLASHALGMRGV